MTARGIMEAQYFPTDQVGFLTITYNEDFLPTVQVEDRFTGQPYAESTLCKRDAQKFRDRMKKNAERMYGASVRFLGAGEYGTEGGRPHYHFIVYGLTQAQLGECAYRSWSVRKSEKLISEHCPTVRYAVPALTPKGYRFEDRPVSCAAGRHQMGFITVGEGNSNSVAYTASYTLSGLTDDSKRPEGVQKEFAMQSNRPGIGAQYMQEYGRALVARYQVPGLPSTYGEGKPNLPLPNMLQLPTPKGLKPYPIDRTMRKHMLLGMGIEWDSEEAAEARRYAFETREEAMFLPGDPLGLLAEARKMADQSKVRAGRLARRHKNLRRSNPH